jgi:hypothetical protein
VVNVGGEQNCLKQYETSVHAISRRGGERRDVRREMLGVMKGKEKAVK